MIKTYVILFCLIYYSNCLSQDLIVTTSNDSINCKITKLKKENIHFIFKNKTEYQSTLIPLSKVSFYKYDFFQKNKIPKEAIPGYEDYQKIRISCSGGYSYAPASLRNNTNSELRNYYNDLRSGYNLETGFTYFINKTIGFGLKYNILKSSNSLDNVNFIGINGENLVGKLEDNISASFFGGSMALRFISKSKKNAFLMVSSIGYMTYTNNQILVDPFTLKSNGLGLVSEFAYDLGLSDNLSLGFQIGMSTGFLNQIELNTPTGIEAFKLPDNERLQGSARLDFSIGLRYYFKQ